MERDLLVSWPAGGAPYSPVTIVSSTVRPMADEPQNIYDDPSFFAGYSTLERFGAGWEKAMERADLLALLPDGNGRCVLDLGCGAGQLAHHLAKAGAAEVIGVDVSERMLALA